MLPIIKVACCFCHAEFECEPDDLIGWDGDTPDYACPPCQSHIEDEERYAREHQEYDTFTDADPGL
jgi:hypothetical protein